MHFTVDAKVFSDAVSTVASTTERRNTVPILSNVLIEADTETVSLKATDLDVELQLSVPAIVKTSGATTVPARLLSDIVRKLPGGAELSFEIKDEQMATVKSGRSRFQLQALPPADFPDMIAKDFSHTFEMPGAALNDLLGQVEFSISTEETRYYLNGIYIHLQDIGGGFPIKLRAVSTDGHRLARNEIEAPSGSLDMPGIIIPRKTIGEILRLSKDVGDKPVNIEVSPNKIRIEFGSGTVLVSKLIDGTFPDYERVIPQANNIFAIVDSKTLAAAADRVATVSSERTRAVKLSFEKGLLTLAVNNPDAGSGTETIEVSYDADKMEVGFNGAYLRDILSVLGAGEVKIALSEPGAPSIITSDKLPNLLTVLMPMRV